jgi:hypothetical protein
VRLGEGGSVGGDGVLDCVRKKELGSAGAEQTTVSIG